MTSPTLQLALTVAPLLLIEGLFSGSEIALLSADRIALQRRAKGGKRGARLALELSSHPERVLSTTLVVTSLCVVLISGLIALYFLGEGGSNEHAELKSVLIASPLIVLLGELIPKTLYKRHAEALAPWVSYPVIGAYFALFPITKILSSYTTKLSRLIGPVEELLTGKRRTTRDDIETLLNYGRSESEIKSSARQMIKRIFDFSDTEAKHALIPLVRIDAIEDTATVREGLEKFEKHRHSRMPVFSGRIDNIVGVLEAGDLFPASDLSQPIRNYISTAHYIAETQSLEDVLLEMSREHAHLVVVVDEHGGAVGILTFEDIVEEIVGEISDEYDIELSSYKEIAPGRWLAQARMEITRINETLGLELPEGDYETLAGFLLQQFGRIPESRDELFFTTPTGSYKFTIRKATERYIESVLVERLDEVESESTGPT